MTTKATATITGLMLACPCCQQSLTAQTYNIKNNENDENNNDYGKSSSMNRSNELNVECVKCKSCIQIPIKLITPLGNEMFFIPPTAQLEFKRSPQHQQIKNNNNNKDNDDDASLSFYALLSLTKEASADEIKRSYYRLAMRHHPDKYQGPDPQRNEERFKKISEAYRVLSDPSLRDRYDRYGDLSALSTQLATEKGSDNPLRGGPSNPEELFQQMFGGDQFVDLIGEISIARDFGDALRLASDSGSNNNNYNNSNSNSNSSSNQMHSSSTTTTMTDEERERRRKERIRNLTTNLLHKLSFYCDHPQHNNNNNNNNINSSSSISGMTESQAVREEFERRIRAEVEDLRVASYGVELLQTIGYMYSLKARQFLGKDELFGLGRWWMEMRERGHYLSETVGTIRSAVQLQSTLAKLQQLDDESGDGGADVNGSAKSSGSSRKSHSKPSLSSEDRKRLEEQAALKGMDTLWKGSKMEVESIIRDVCDSILQSSTTSSTAGSIDKYQLRRRAMALRIVGEIYESTVKP